MNIAVKWFSRGANKWIVLGLAGVTLSFFAGASIYAGTLPLKGTADSVYHLDYAWRVSQKDLPEFWGGRKVPGFSRQPVQFVSQHPPLYYVIISPAGALLGAGHTAAAVGLARVITMLLAFGCVAAFAWGGWVLGGKKRLLYLLAVPAILSSLTPFLKISGDSYNVALVLLFNTLALVLSALFIKNGIDKKLVIASVVVCTLGMASRASFLSSLLILFMAISLSALVNTKGSFVQKIRTAILPVLIIGTFVAAGSGWFYWRNYQASGKWYRSAPQSWAHDLLGVQKRSFKQAVTSKKIWLLVPEQLYGRPWQSWPAVYSIPFNTRLSTLAFTITSIGALVWVYRKRQRFKNIDIRYKLIFVLFVLQCLLVIAQQIRHATGYGGINARYMLPMWLPLGIFMTTGLLVWEKLKGQAVTVLLVINWLAFIGNTMWYLGKANKTSVSNWEQLTTSVSNNGLNPGFAPLLIILIFSGVAMTGVALWHLSIEIDRIKGRGK